MASDTDHSENMVAGAVAGMIAETIMHPFDTLNTRLKVFSDNKSKAESSTDSTRSIRIAGTRGTPSTVINYKPSTTIVRPTMMKFLPAHSPLMQLHSGTMIGSMYRIVSVEGWRALYAGLPATLFGAFPSTALYFSAYEWTKKFGETKYNDFSNAVQAATGTKPDNELVYLPAVYFASGACGELASSTVYVPFEVVKSRMQMGKNPRLSTGGWIQNQVNYNSSFEALTLIWRGEGIRGLYSGWRGNIVMDCCFSGLQFLIYELLKQRMQYEQFQRGISLSVEEELPLGPTFMIGAYAGGIAAVITNPLEVVVTRLMVQGHTLPDAATRMTPSSHRSRYRGIIHGLQTIAREEGFAGLMRGVIPRLVSNAPMAALTFAVYENIKQWFSSNRQDKQRRQNDDEGFVA